jgi:hypothetical protein
MPKRLRSSARSLATKSLELSLAAPQVVAHRVGRMMAAGPNPSASDRRGFAMMGSEKVLAFYQSWAAIWLQAAMAAQASWLRATSSVPPTSASGASRVVQRALTGHATAVTRVLNAGLKPVHAKAVSNSKRLRRRVK